MTIAVLAATAVGRRHAAFLAASLPDAVALDGPLASAAPQAWTSADALVVCAAVGAVTRLIAPLLGDKHADPPVVVVDDAGAFAVALVGGHHGGNDLARAVAGALGAQAVVTTASDVLGLPALDSLGARLGLRLDPDLADTAAVGAALVAGEAVTLTRRRPWPIGPLPVGVTETAEPAAPAIVVTDQLGELPRPAVVYRPPSLVVGVGASRGVSAEEVDGLVTTALAEARLSPLSVVTMATADLKADEVGIVAVAAARALPLATFSVAALTAVEVPTPSEVVRAAVGTPSVAEAAALLAAGEGGELVVQKRSTAAATVAVARRQPRGRLALVSAGPGTPDLLPPLARTALADADLLVGLDQYVDRVRPFLRPGTEVATSPIGDEVVRAEQAVDAAGAGRSVALLSGGDVGVYAMGSPALERADTSIDVVVVPGVTAATAAAALLGSPLGHDHCAISLSDLLTPWEVIRRRVKAAAEGDFVVTFYNPRSRGRSWQLHEARLLLLEHRGPETPVGLVTDAYRPTQRVAVTTLGALDVAEVDMLTTVVVGSTQTRVIAGRMVTPRGYA